MKHCHLLNNLLQKLGIVLLLFFLEQKNYAQEIPLDMSYIAGGQLTIGDEQGLENEKPIFTLNISPFYIDPRPVTVGEFKIFVKIIGYKTEAERNGGAWIFDDSQNQWQWKAGAYWLYPLGTDQPKAQEQQAVTQISWNDAKAYANFRKKRLPTEFEWEFIAKNATQYNLQFSGNLWEWTESWYRTYGETSAYSKRMNEEKTLRGGFFLPAIAEDKPNFRPSRRTSAKPHEAFFFVGFRCAKNTE